MNGIPVLMVQGGSLAEAWEMSLVQLWMGGTFAKTQYDKPGDPESIDASMMMVVEEPFSDPMIHRCFPGGLEDLEEYRLEVVEGIKNHWVRNPNDPEDTRWEYTYNDRLCGYTTPVVSPETGMPWPHKIDQIAIMVEALVKNPHSRRAQAVTWNVYEDIRVDDPPCLQSVWCRITADKDDTPRLNMNVRFRSRDAYDAAFMNAFAFIHLQKSIADRISEKIGYPIELGRYCDFSDSYHIYGRRLHGGDNPFIEGFWNHLESRTFEERTWPLSFAQPIFDEARPNILEKVKWEG